MKTRTFTIETVAEGLERFRNTFEAVQAGKGVRPREVVGFTSIEAARNVLTRERLALVRAIRTRHPGSIDELAKLVGRNLKNVQQDVRLLEKHGLVQPRETQRGAKGKVEVPEVPFDTIALRIAF